MITISNPRTLLPTQMSSKLKINFSNISDSDHILSRDESCLHCMNMQFGDFLANVLFQLLYPAWVNVQPPAVTVQIKLFQNIQVRYIQMFSTPSKNTESYRLTVKSTEIYVKKTGQFCLVNNLIGRCFVQSITYQSF